LRDKNNQLLTTVSELRVSQDECTPDIFEGHDKHISDDSLSNDSTSPTTVLLFRKNKIKLSHQS
jgi:hypothetical protein